MLKPLEKAENLRAFLQYLPSILRLRHSGCDCSKCDFDRLVIVSLEQIHQLLTAEIILFRNKKPLPAGLMVRPIAELVIDLLFINLDLNERVQQYFVYEINYDIQLLDTLISRYAKMRKPIDDLLLLKINREKFLSDNNWSGSKRIRSWTDVSLFDRLKKIKEEIIYPFDISFEKEHIDYLHKITHSSVIQFAIGHKFAVGELPDDTPMLLTIDWIFVFLEFIKYSFKLESLEPDLKKYYKMFYEDEKLE
ncbi:MAG: DUF5677 domain-containing protein [bacterium]|nr:DUF5677 domain-containing protein [bacterium]